MKIEPERFQIALKKTIKDLKLSAGQINYSCDAFGSVGREEILTASPSTLEIIFNNRLVYLYDVIVSNLPLTSCVACIFCNYNSCRDCCVEPKCIKDGNIVADSVYGQIQNKIYLLSIVAEEIICPGFGWDTEETVDDIIYRLSVDQRVMNNLLAKMEQVDNFTAFIDLKRQFVLNCLDMMKFQRIHEAAERLAEFRNLVNTIYFWQE